MKDINEKIEKYLSVYDNLDENIAGDFNKLEADAVKIIRKYEDLIKKYNMDDKEAKGMIKSRGYNFGKLLGK
jgi:hypothetical protein